jgi:hypothetical protein
MQVQGNRSATMSFSAHQGHPVAAAPPSRSVAGAPRLVTSADTSTVAGTRGALLAIA